MKVRRVIGITAGGAALLFLAPLIAITGVQQGQCGASVAGGVALPVSNVAGLNGSQQTFVAVLAADTGLDPAVVAAWALAEEGGQAIAPNGPDNWLNVGATDVGFYGGSNPAWSDPTTAATATAAWLKGSSALGYGTASAGVQAILKAAGQPPGVQIAAIQSSGWASSGYPNLPALYQQVTGAKFVSLPVVGSGVACAGVVTPGSVATIQPDGSATIPASAPAAVRAAIAAGNAIRTTDYSLERNPGMLTTVQTAYDCSGSTDFVLYNAGLTSPQVDVGNGVAGDSTLLESYGLAGAGQWITVYASGPHAFIEVAGIVMDTAHYSATTPPGGGPRWQPASILAAQLADGNVWTVRHPAGL